MPNHAHVGYSLVTNLVRQTISWDMLGGAYALAGTLAEMYDKYSIYKDKAGSTVTKMETFHSLQTFEFQIYWWLDYIFMKYYSLFKTWVVW